MPSARRHDTPQKPSQTLFGGLVLVVLRGQPIDQIRDYIIDLRRNGRASGPREGATVAEGWRTPSYRGGRGLVSDAVVRRGLVSDAVVRRGLTPVADEE